MTTRDLLVKQFGFVYGTIDANLKDITQEESLRQPEPGGNCTNWILAHLIAVQNEALRLLGEEPVLEHRNLPRGDQSPYTRADQGIPFEDARERFAASRERFLAALADLGDDELREGGLKDPFGGTTTRAGLLTLIAFHQAYHAGQLGMSRRLVGREGAIRAPAARASA